MKNIFVCLALFINLCAYGQSAKTIDRPLDSATVDELVDKLAPDPFVRSRSLGRNLAPSAKSIDLVIQFDFDSAKLQPSSKPLLDNLANAMKSDRLLQINFKIEGHTDAKGTESYNQTLSQKRADSVVSYMAEKGVDRSRLESIGKGFSDLLYTDKPHAMENRRVRITTSQ